MKNKEIKKIIIFLVIILMIILTIIMSISKYIQKNKELYLNKDKAQKGEDVNQTYGKNQNGRVDIRAYFDIKMCMQKYLDYINIKNLKYGYYNKQNKYISTVNENEIRQKIYNLLSDKYIREKNITVENLYNYITVLNKSVTYVPIEGALIQDGDIKSFITYGLIQAKDNYTIIDKVFAVVNIDIINNNFSVELIDGNYTSISEINLEKFENTITINNDNKMPAYNVNTEEYPNEYINIIKGLALGAPEKLYNKLDEEYRNVKFADVEEFKNYIEKNKKEILRAKLKKYQTETIEDKTRYICVDQFENYYIINQNEVFQDYTLMLDKYTINLKEFVEKYDNSENNVKMALNIEKLIEATKNKDYKYVYSKLNETFKSTNFKTQEEFEKYINNVFNVENDTISYEKYEEIAGVHIYDVKVIKKDKEVDAQIVMKLKSRRDFEVSFSAK